MKEYLLLLVLILCIILAVQNTSTTGLYVLLWRLKLQKGLFILLFLILGYILGLASRGKK